MKIFYTHPEDTEFSRLINQMQLVRSATNYVFHEDGTDVLENEWRELEKAYMEYVPDGDFDIKFVVGNRVSIAE